MTEIDENSAHEIQVHKELLELSSRLLNSIDQQDWTTYCELCDESLTAFEPEAVGNLVAGMSFHEFYFRQEGNNIRKQSTISSPHVRLLGDVAVVTYVRLVQKESSTESAETLAFEETRVWQKNNGRWQHVHFHRSPGA
ncbi:MAG: hypothetical protein Tsb009_08750 [Planctomycetaceae bacterium]